MSKRDTKLLFKDIIESGQKIIGYTSGMSYNDFINSSITIDAVIRNFEIIGEASNRLPDEIKDSLPDLNWTKIRGFRNRLAHDHFGIDYQLVWSTIEELLPNLITTIAAQIDIL